MNDSAFQTFRSMDRPAAELRIYPRPSHPILSADELERLAQRIAVADGIPPAKARQQIVQFRAASWPPKARAIETTSALERRYRTRPAKSLFELQGDALWQ